MSRGRVVILEDDEWVARLLETGLSEHGYQVTTAGEALAGFRRAQEMIASGAKAPPSERVRKMIANGIRRAESLPANSEAKVSAPKN